MTTTTVDTLAPHTFPNGSTTRAIRQVPAGFQSVTFQLNCTTGNPASPFTGFASPFNSTAMAITFGLQWSWDGGATFPQSTEGTQHGSPTGIWGTDHHTGSPVMTPSVTLGLPFDLALGGLPDAYEPYASLAGGPVTTGLTVLETTA